MHSHASSYILRWPRRLISNSAVRRVRMQAKTTMFLSSSLIFSLLVIVRPSLAGVQRQPNCNRDPDAQVLILGAGLAGLGVARRLTESGINDFLILEQRDRVGGRLQSAQFAGGIVQLGPQWVLFVDQTVPEENQQPLWPLIQKCNISVRDPPLGGLRAYTAYTSLGENMTLSTELINAFQRYAASTSAPAVNPVLAGLRDGADISVAAGLRENGWSAAGKPIEELVEYISYDFVFGRPTDTASFRDSFDPQVNIRRFFSFGNNTANYIITDPYSDIAKCLADEFLTPNDERLILESTVSTVSWGDECVCATATKDGEEREYCAPYAILTFSVGELTNNVITFIPELPLAKRLELQRLEMANFLKIFIAFNETFWDTGVEFIYYIDEVNGREYYPVFTPWGDFLPNKPPILEAYLFGDTALRVAYQDLEITKKQIAEVMRNIYGDKASDPVDIIMHDFIVNRYFYGDFSSATPGVGDNTFEELNHPIGQLYLAGEAYISGQHSSAHGALVHGTSIGERIMQEILGPLTVSFINDSPQLEGNSTTAEFIVSRSARLIQCSVRSQERSQERVNCSSGKVTFTNLELGDYTLKIIARNDKDDRTAVFRRFFIGNGSHCTVHLINSGLSVYGDNAKVEFTTTGLPVTGIMCTIDSQTFPCESPLRLKDLERGRHRVSITPLCEGIAVGYSRTFFIS